MKNIFKLLFVFSVICSVSCGDDEDGGVGGGGNEECTVDSFVGVYDGTIECPDEDPADGTLTITKLSETTINVTDTDNVDFIMTVDGCVASYEESIFGVSVSQTLTLDGDDIDYRAVNSAFGIEVVCTGSMTRN